jgi:hypothetical protein
MGSRPGNDFCIILQERGQMKAETFAGCIDSRDLMLFELRVQSHVRSYVSCGGQRAMR